MTRGKKSLARVTADSALISASRACSVLVYRGTSAHKGLLEIFGFMPKQALESRMVEILNGLAPLSMN